MGDGHAAARLRALCRLVLLFRLFALNATILYLPGHLHEGGFVLVALVVVVLESYAPLRWWDRIGPALVRHPILLAVDLAIAEAILLFAGAQSPFFYVTLGTALLAGVLYARRGAIVFSVLLLIGYFGVLALRRSVGAEPDADSFQMLVNLPLAYPLFAAGGAAVRRLLDRQAQTESALRASERSAAASDERGRVAREMHDSLGKTLYGIALSARALATRLRGDPALSERAAALSEAAQVAAGEARELISDLRSDRLHLPLGEAVAEHVAEWSRASGVTATIAGRECDLPSPGSRYELFCILKEALRNVERHAEADSVHVALRVEDSSLVLAVSDDGVGAEVDGDPRALEPDGHFGLVGMAERARRLGGRLEVEGRAGAGLTVQAAVPVKQAEPTPEAAYALVVER